MIQITYNRKVGVIYAQGHAGWATEGKDIVCAGVSATLDTLVYMLAYLAPRRVGEYAGKGLRRIEARGRKCRRILDAGAAILEQIAEQYPDHVSLAREDGKGNGQGGG